MRGLLFVLAISVVAAGAYTLTPRRVIQPQTGLWTFEMRVERVSGTNLPPGITRAQLVEALLPARQRGTQTFCRTTRQAASWSDRDWIGIHGFSRSQCRTTVSERSGETFHAAGTCRDRRGTERDFSIDGTIGEQNVDLRAVYKDRVAGARPRGVRVESEIHLIARRVGSCGPGSDVDHEFENMRRAMSRHGARDTAPEATNLAATPDGATP